MKGVSVGVLARRVAVLFLLWTSVSAWRAGADDWVADLVITKTDGVLTATPGGSVTYTITASNAGPNDAPGSIVTDDFPASLSCTWTCAGMGGATCTASGSGDINDIVSLPAYASVTYTASCTISSAASGSLENDASVAVDPDGLTVDPHPDSNSRADTDTLKPESDLAISKTDGVSTATPGRTVTYTIVASNAGPSDAAEVPVTDAFPATLSCTWTCEGEGGGTCTGSGSGDIDDTVNLPAGASVIYTATCTVSEEASESLTNTAFVGPELHTLGIDPNGLNNRATDIDRIVSSRPGSVSIPTVSSVGLAALVLLLAGAGWRIVRRSKVGA